MEGNMVNINVRIPGEVHRLLTKYKNEQKQHLSLNALIVEAIQEKVNEVETIRAGKTQIDTDFLDQALNEGDGVYRP
jgi:predicted membrane chloride channel (bestrophin family)